MVTGKLQEPQGLSLIQQLIGKLRTKQHLHFIKSQAPALFLVPGSDNRLLQPQHLGQPLTLLPGQQQFANARNAVAALQQLADQLESAQVCIVIDPDSPAPLRRRQQATVLIGAQISHSGTGRAGQFIDAEFLHRFRRSAQRPLVQKTL